LAVHNFYEELKFGAQALTNSYPPYLAMKEPKTREVIAESLTRMLMEGPEVSLSGSPTVSPTTAAACSGVEVVFETSCPSMRRI